MLHEQLENIFRTVFNDDTITLTDKTTAADIEGWDSVATISLMFGVEQTFDVLPIVHESPAFIRSAWSCWGSGKPPTAM